MKKNIVICIVLLLALNFAAGGFCEKEVIQKKRPVKPKIEKERKDWTKAELMEMLTFNIESEGEVLDLIPQIKRKKSEDGKDYYVYLVGAQEKRFEELDKEMLEKIWIRVNQAATQIRTQRIQKQLESIRQAQNAQAAAMRSVPKIPQIPAQPPKAPVNVPQPPKVPQVPRK